MKTHVKLYFLAFLISSIAGTLLHFLYSTTKFFPFAFLAPMNESVWEHLKLAVIPLLLAFFVLYKITKPEPLRFLTSASLGLLFSAFTMVSLYYLLSCGLGIEGLIWDILIYYISMFGAFYLTYRTQYFNFSKWECVLLMALATLLLVLLIIFTVLPPDLPLFADHSA